MDNDIGGFLFFIFILSVAFFVYATNQMTNDYKIQGASKIKINNAVYKCEKIQELDLK